MAPRGALREVRTKSGFATKEEAVAAAAELQAARASGAYVPPSRLTVGQYLEQWLQSVRPPAVRGGTWVGYQVNVRRHLAPRLGSVPLQQLTRVAVKAAYDELAAHGRRGGRLSPKTLHNVHLTLRKALGDAVEDRLLSHNPADAAHRLHRDEPEMQTWSPRELAAFLAGVAEHEWFALWRLAATTGMRRGELLGLRWSDLELGSGQLQIVQQRVRGVGAYTYGPPKTKAGKRRVDLDAATVAALQAHRQAQGIIRPAFGAGYDADADLVFARADGSPLDPDTVSGTFERLVRGLRLPRIRLHDLRHTHATLALVAGVHPKVVQERLGHSSVKITLDRYSHAVPGMQAEAASRIAAIVDGGS